MSILHRMTPSATQRS